MGANPEILDRAHSRKPGGNPEEHFDPGRNALAVYPRRNESGKRCARVVHTGRGAARASRKQRDSTRFVSELRLEREALSEVSGIFPQIEAPFACNLGEK